ncbi:MAG TPA: hypothetical protein VHE35_26690 [Kofleriaceae bacterium]|nr:hypothetical protein [Kofleriaceae bacterium]
MGLSAEQILRVWEEGRDRHPLDRALVVLAAGLPDASWDDLCRLPIGRRDAALLELRARTFGERLELLARCPACGAQAELALDVRALVQPAAAPVQELLLDDGATLRYRLPDSRDLAAVLALDGEEAARRLQARCLIDEGEGEAALAPALAARLDAHMAAADPQAETELALTCPACGAGWTELLDIGEAFFAELGREATRLLGEVDTLARTYGWREADILAMSAARRASYLELAAG